MAASASAKPSLNAAALEFRKRGKRTLFLRAEDFMRHFLGALYRKDTLAFKEELRTAEVLIIDDLQHICRSTATASEFLYYRQRLLPISGARCDRCRPRAPGLGRDWGADVNRASRVAYCIVLDKARPRTPGLSILKARACGIRPATSPDVVLPEMCWSASPSWKMPVRAK